MTSAEFLAALERRAAAAGAAADVASVERFWVYFDLLRLWNQKINLTGFDLRVPSDAAIDRLFVEPLVAAAAVTGPVRTMLDIGSGGGSPGIPVSVVLAPDLTVLVEARVRKATFLREVARALGLSDRIEIQNTRFEDLTANDGYSGAFDLVTVRAVRAEAKDLERMAGFLKAGGQLSLFRSNGDGVSPAVKCLRCAAIVPLGTTQSGTIELLEKVPAPVFHVEHPG